MSIIVENNNVVPRGSACTELLEQPDYIPLAVNCYLFLVKRHLIQQPREGFINLERLQRAFARTYRLSVRWWLAQLCTKDMDLLSGSRVRSLAQRPHSGFSGIEVEFVGGHTDTQTQAQTQA
jgi:hypothetical protein